MNAIGNKIKSWFENQLACRIQKQTELSPFRSAAGSAVGSGHHRSAVHGKTNAVQSCQSWGFPGGAAVQPGLGSDWIRNSVRLQRSILCVSAKSGNAERSVCCFCVLRVTALRRLQAELCVYPSCLFFSFPLPAGRNTSG